MSRGILTLQNCPDGSHDKGKNFVYRSVVQHKSFLIRFYLPLVDILYAFVELLIDTNFSILEHGLVKGITNILSGWGLPQ